MLSSTFFYWSKIGFAASCEIFWTLAQKFTRFFTFFNYFFKICLTFPHYEKKLTPTLGWWEGVKKILIIVDNRGGGSKNRVFYDVIYESALTRPQFLKFTRIQNWKNSQTLLKYPYYVSNFSEMTNMKSNSKNNDS